jgi:exoribonuclease-2
MTQHHAHQRINLADLANQVMMDRGFASLSLDGALHQLDQIKEPALSSSPSSKDLTDLLWCSIDNDDSKDLDQLTVSESHAQGESHDHGGDCLMWTVWSKRAVP